MCIWEHLWWCGVKVKSNSYKYSRITTSMLMLLLLLMLLDMQETAVYNEHLAVEMVADVIY